MYYLVFETCWTWVRISEACDSEMNRFAALKKRFSAMTFGAGFSDLLERHSGVAIPSLRSKGMETDWIPPSSMAEM